MGEAIDPEGIAGALTIIPVPGVAEVTRGDDVAALLLVAARDHGLALRDGDVVVVSSKVVSKSLGLWSADRDAAIDQATVRVVAERRSGPRVTRIVESTTGPVMAAAGVDASNTGGRSEVLVLPEEPDCEAQRLRQSLLAATGLSELGVILSDTAGRPWRSGQTDFALGAAGVQVLDDLRGSADADGQPLTVTARAVADELAAAADLVKGKADAVPAAIVRGVGWVRGDRGEGAATLVRTGQEDWFAYGHAEAVRAALGTEPGSAQSAEIGIASTAPESRTERVSRAVAVALAGAPEAGVDVGADVVRVSAPTAYVLGLAVARLQVALWGEGLRGEDPRLDSVTGAAVAPSALEVTLELTEPDRDHRR
ncbi:MAG TPA: coenzyme F420-0:L-glutamate ligase [Pedococcus sp.]|nr:coenzyme F420-0:L-glutamate ligase [Pedococcus sp.]